MANLTNSAKLIQEMAKKANRTELPEVNNSTVNFTVNGNTGSQSMTTNQASNSTVNLTVNKTTVGLGNVDNTSDANKPISTATQAALDLKADKSDLSSVYKYKGSVASYSNLPSTGLTAGDVYNVEDTGMNYAWTGSAWDALGSSVDLSNYLAKNNTTAFTPTGDYNPATKKYVDDHAPNVIAVTQAEYNALPAATKNDGKLRIITDAPQIEIPDYESKSAASGGTDESLVTTGEKHIWNNKANDSDVVKLTGNQTINGTKTFGTSPVVPSKTTDATNTGTAIATEAQVYKKANTSDVLTKTNTTSYTPSADYHPATKKYVDDNAGVTYNAGEGINIGNITKNGRQGPSPDGFHVPSRADWLGVVSIMNGLGFTKGNQFKTNLHMPMSGVRSYTDASVGSYGTLGEYLTSSGLPFQDESDNVGYLKIKDNTTVSVLGQSPALGCNIRSFKDSYVVPTSSWTIINGTLGSAGIFRNQTDGLISITSDGSTGYTIMDKNLGATTVYSNGDTLTQSNMGYMYQWGNNYGFPSTGTISNTSSTQVDSSNYGPGNYYSSDTFIIGNFNWANNKNRDLWGEVTGTYTLNNAITNTGVLSVNGETGDVTIQTGGNYTAGNGIDITNDEIGLDGTYSGTDYSAMQGPCPDGFHVPLKSEWTAIINTGKTLGAWTTSYGGNDFKAKMKTPYAGMRAKASGNISYNGTLAVFWVSDRTAGQVIMPSGVMPGFSDKTSEGFSLRPFKDKPAIPDNSRTTIYSGTGSAGIFHNATLGLISISSDGTNWITIADKNLGATTVYNDGDTLTADNCGYFYQWGNNYGFPYSGSITTSSTQVDASSYGPGNYYNSSTFITGYNDRSSVQNDNLWGGETGIQTVSGNLVLGDKLYKIVTSTSAPASGTASNIITFVTA